MSVRLANRSFQYPVGIAENMLIEVGNFTFPVDFIILEMEKDSTVPLILGRPFLHTADAVIRVKQKQLNLRVGTERTIFNIDSAMKYSYSNDDTCFSIDIIDEILEEDFDALLDEDIPGICPSFCKHKIQLLDDKKPVVQKQRSPWVSPIYCILKKGGITVVTNENDERVPTRTVTGWRGMLSGYVMLCYISKVLVCWQSFHDMIEEAVEVFMKEIVARTQGVQCCGLEVDKQNHVISKLPPPTNIKGV
ncbi:reverse transcriptase domain-containing protein [Tanacetum coccineum]